MDISSDTNIWIDFQILDAIMLPFKLSHKFYLSEEALEDELLTPPGVDKCLVDYGLISLKITDEEFLYAITIRNKYPKLSIYDAIALAISKKRAFILLTGDKRLRKAAMEEDVEIRGTIWIFDELLRENIITEQEFIEFMKELKKQNGKNIRLPESEINKRIKRII